MRSNSEVIHEQRRVIWAQHFNELSCFRHRHDGVYLATTADHEPKGCPHSIGSSPHVSVCCISFLVPGVVSPSLSPAFAIPAAYGDLVAAILILAGITTLALAAARTSWAIPIV